MIHFVVESAIALCRLLSPSSPRLPLKLAFLVPEVSTPFPGRHAVRSVCCFSAAHGSSSPRNDSNCGTEWGWQFWQLRTQRIFFRYFTFFL